MKSIKWGAYDLETSCPQECCWKKGKRAKIKCWVFKDNNGDVLRGHSKKDWLEVIANLTKQKSKVYLWGHNALNFDIRFFWEDFVWDKENFKCFKDWGVKYKNITFFDSYKIYSSKLEALPASKEQREKKIQGKELFNDLRYHQSPMPTDFIDELLDYCENDVDIVWNLVASLPTYKKGTKASLGMYLIKKEFLSYWDWKKYFPNFARSEFDQKREFVEKCYSGALNFLHNEQENKDAKCFVVDVVSEYPSIMRNRPLPIGKGQWMDSQFNNLGIEKGKIYDGSEGFIGFYRLKVNYLQLKKEYADIPKIIQIKNNYGVKQGKCRVSNCDLYFVGNELKFLLNYYEGDFKIVRGLVFRTKTGVLAGYVDHFLGQKQQIAKEIDEIKNRGEKVPYEMMAQYCFAKYMLNAVYGKFGQRVYWKEEVLQYEGGKIPKGIKRNEYFWHKSQHRYYHFVLKDKVRSKGHNYVPYSAAISAYARVDLLEKAIKHHKLLLEAETDRLTFRERPDNFVTGDQLGEWKEKKYLGTGYRANSAKYVQWGNDPENIIAKQVPRHFHHLLTFKKQTIEIPHWKKEANSVRVIKQKITLRDPSDNPKYALVNGIWKCLGDCDGYHEWYGNLPRGTPIRSNLSAKSI